MVLAPGACTRGGGNGYSMDAENSVGDRSHRDASGRRAIDRRAIRHADPIARETLVDLAWRCLARRVGGPPRADRRPAAHPVSGRTGRAAADKAAAGGIAGSLARRDPDPAVRLASRK